MIILNILEHLLCSRYNSLLFNSFISYNTLWSGNSAKPILLTPRLNPIYVKLHAYFCIYLYPYRTFGPIQNAFKTSSPCIKRFLSTTICGGPNLLMDLLNRTKYLLTTYMHGETFSSIWIHVTSTYSGIFMIFFLLFSSHFWTVGFFFLSNENLW